MGTVQDLVCSLVVILTCLFGLSSAILTKTVTEREPVTLKCTDSVVSSMLSTDFNWYKTSLANSFYYNYQVARYFHANGGVHTTSRDLANRATVDANTGALTIHRTKVSDEHIYACWIRSTATGDIKNETQLIITGLSSTIPTKTVEEGKPVTLNCTDSVVTKTPSSSFIWYKASLAYFDPGFTVAYYDEKDGAQTTLRDLKNRATVDPITGALTIHSTKKSDEHIYACYFINIASGDIRNETKLIITGSSTILTKTVEEGKPVTLNCTETDSVVSKTPSSSFIWFKANLSYYDPGQTVAYYDEENGAQTTLRDLKNRATVDANTGALTIFSTKVSDEHVYACLFRFTATGEILNETKLNITVNKCSSGPCFNQGTCVPDAGVVAGYRCNCVTTYTGNVCQTSVCASTPCQHGGTCQWNPSGSTGYLCQCTSDYTGSMCQTAQQIVNESKPVSSASWWTLGVTLVVYCLLEK